MATSPLFVANVATLKAKLRLSGVPTDGSADVLIDEALLVVRAGFYRDLGRSRVQSIQALSFTENPETDNEVLRAAANSAEIKWVRAELMRTMPMQFVDGNADAQQLYHDFGAFREATQRQLDEERVRLMDDVREALSLLRGAETVGNETQGLRVYTSEPTCRRPQPGDSARPNGLGGLFG